MRQYDTFLLLSVLSVNEMVLDFVKKKKKTIRDRNENRWLTRPSDPGCSMNRFEIGISFIRRERFVSGLPRGFAPYFTEAKKDLQNHLVALYSQWGNVCCFLSKTKIFSYFFHCHFSSTKKLSFGREKKYFCPKSPRPSFVWRDNVFCSASWCLSSQWQLELK